MKTLLALSACLLMPVLPLTAQDASQSPATEVQDPGMQMLNLPDLIVTQATRVNITTAQGAPAGFVDVPKGVKFHPDAVDATYAYDTMMNGQIMRIELVKTNYVDAKAKLELAQQGKDENPDASLTVDEEIVGRIKITEILPNGFLGDEYQTADGDSGTANAYISGMDTSKLQVGQWWTGTVYYVGHWSKPGSTTTYEHFTINPKNDKDVKTVTAATDKATESGAGTTVTFDELRQLKDSLQLQDTANNLQRLTVKDAQAGFAGIGGVTPDSVIRAQIKKDKLQALGAVQPAWQKAAATAKDWLANRKMTQSFKSWLQLLVTTNDAMGASTVGKFRRGVADLQTQWLVIESLNSGTNPS